MDFSRTGWLALYSKDSPVRVRAVEAWDEPDGAALVVDEQRGCLCQARSMRGFERLEKGAQVVAATPAAPGWRLEIGNSDSDRNTFVVPIAAWLVDDAGNLHPVSGSNDPYLTTINPVQRTQILPPDEGHPVLGTTG
jgi:hypothetical protein